MHKFALGGILCFVCAYLGIVGKKYYDKRYAYLKDFYSFVLELIDNISFAQDRLSDIGKRYADSGKGAFRNDLRGYSETLEDGGAAEKCFDSKYLKKCDRAYVQEFFMNLGKVDYDTQLSKLNLTKAQMEKTVSKAENDCKTTGNLLSKLGLLAGIAIMIILA